MGVRKLLLRPVELVRGGIAFGDGKFSDIIISKSSVETDLSERQTKKWLRKCCFPKGIKSTDHRSFVWRG